MKELRFPTETTPTRDGGYFQCFSIVFLPRRETSVCSYCITVPFPKRKFLYPLVFVRENCLIECVLVFLPPQPPRDCGSVQVNPRVQGGTVAAHRRNDSQNVPQHYAQLRPHAHLEEIRRLELHREAGKLDHGYMQLEALISTRTWYRTR